MLKRVAAAAHGGRHRKCRPPDYRALGPIAYRLRWPTRFAPAFVLEPIAPQASHARRCANQAGHNPASPSRRSPVSRSQRAATTLGSEGRRVQLFDLVLKRAFVGS